MSVNQSAGILAIWHDMVPEHEQALNDWHNQEHHAKRVALDGFFSACQTGLYQRIFTMGG